MFRSTTPRSPDSSGEGFMNPPPYAHSLGIRSLHNKTPFTSHSEYRQIGDDPWVDQQHTQFSIDHRSQRSEQISKVRTVCKALGLLLFYNQYKRLRGGSAREDFKIALIKSRWVALCRSVVHLIPLSAAVVLIAFNAQNYYVGGELAGPSGQDTEKLAALQFTAKVHELFMLASITTIVFSYVRKELVSDGVPFGAAIAGLQVGSLSFLWSPEMGGILVHDSSSRRKKLIMILFFFLMTLLGVSVGPSTAILMRPRLDTYPAGGTNFWINGTGDILKPLMISDDPSLQHCATDTGSTACPHAYWQSISQQFLSAWPTFQYRGTMPRNISLPGDLVSVLMQTTVTTPTTYHNARSMATASPFFLAEYVSQLSLLWAIAAGIAQRSRHIRYSFRGDNSFRIANGWQPGVHALCTSIHLAAEASFSPAFPDIKAYNTTIGQLVGHQVGVNVPYTNTEIQNDVQNLLRGNQPGVLWLGDPGLMAATNSSINAIVVYAYSDLSHDVHTCSVDARYIDVDITSNRDQIGQSAWGVIPFDWLDRGLRVNNSPQLTISPSWARYVDPLVVASNLTIMQQNLYWYYNEFDGASFVEAMLSSFLLNGLIRNVASPNMLGQLRDNDVDDETALKRKNSWIWCFLPRSRMCTEDSALNATLAQRAEGSKLRFVALDIAYAYSNKGLPAKAGIVVLVVYVVCAGVHCAWTVWAGSTSDAWDSASEIAALAMNSQGSRVFRNTGAGFETTSIFEEKVRIRVRDDNLEYVLRDTDWGVTDVRSNTRYG